MYGADRLTTPLLRMRDGAFAKDGEFTPVTWDQAFDVMAEKFKAALKAKGLPASACSAGQWTIWEGYAASKLMKGGFRWVNIDPNARHCMASAAFGFMRTFGMDEPMGCYDDIEAADAFVLWGSNMAEMHPILWTRVTDRRLSQPHVKVAVLDVRAPQLRPRRHTDRVRAAGRPRDAQLRGRAHHPDGLVNRDFVDRHTLFRRGNTDIGYGLRLEHPLEQKAKNAKDLGGSTEMISTSSPRSSTATTGPWSATKGVPRAAWRRWPSSTPTQASR